MTSTTVSTINRIRHLKDDFRRTFVGGVVLITAGVEAMPDEQRRSLLAQVRTFDVFTEDNDPHGEHDLGAVDEGGVPCFWKIHYYDRAIEFGSPDPADPTVTTRVLTVMRAAVRPLPPDQERRRVPIDTRTFLSLDLWRLHQCPANKPKSSRAQR
jgi:hypothetical protein